MKREKTIVIIVHRRAMEIKKIITQGSGIIWGIRDCLLLLKADNRIRIIKLSVHPIGGNYHKRAEEARACP